MGLLLKLHLSSYVTKNTKDFSITANFIVLFLLRVMKDVIISCLITTLPQFMGMASVSTSTLDLFYMFRYTSQICRSTDFPVPSALASLPGFITYPKGGYDWP